MESIVTTNRLCRHFQTGSGVVRALDDVSLTIAKGEFTAAIGPSGSGKTTLLNQIGALDHPTSGTISIDGAEITHLDRASLTRLRLWKVGFVFQAYNLIPVLSVLENVEYVMLLQRIDHAERQARALQVIDEVGLAGLESRRPAELSGGQQQRVAVARAVASKPAIVLADEPTANLDSKTGAALLDMMRALNKEHQITFLFSTHDPMVMERAQRIVSMHDGRIVDDEFKTSTVVNQDHGE